jgi:hypothetical protein
MIGNLKTLRAAQPVISERLQIARTLTAFTTEDVDRSVAKRTAGHH